MGDDLGPAAAPALMQALLVSAAPVTDVAAQA
jgi:hypothetical protein